MTVASVGKRGWFSLPFSSCKRGRHRNHSGSTTTGSGQGTKGFFTQFYVKLSALPLVFLFIRVWGTARIILQASGFRDSGVDQFLAVMQAFFDPSQGFFNALLFVFLSAEDRANLLVSLAMLCQSLGACLPCCGGLATRATQAKPRNLAPRGF